MAEAFSEAGTPGLADSRKRRLSAWPNLRSGDSARVKRRFCCGDLFVCLRAYVGAAVIRTAAAVCFTALARIHPTESQTEEWVWVG